MDFKTEGRNQTMDNFCENHQFWSTCKCSKSDQEILQKHRALSIKLCKFLREIRYILWFANNLTIFFFQVFVFIVLFLYCLITSPMLLIVMALSGGVCYYLSSRNVSYQQCGKTRNLLPPKNSVKSTLNKNVAFTKFMSKGVQDNSFQISLIHSVEITGINSPVFLAKISWK